MAADRVDIGNGDLAVAADNVAACEIVISEQGVALEVSLRKVVVSNRGRTVAVDIADQVDLRSVSGQIRCNIDSIIAVNMILLAEAQGVCALGNKAEAVFGGELLVFSGNTGDLGLIDNLAVLDQLDGDLVIGW